MQSVESCALALRARLSIVTFPQLAGAWSLAGLLSDVVTVIEAEGEPGCCLHLPQGRATVWVPPGEPYPLVHEMGEALFSCGLASVLEPYLPSSAKIERWRMEATADRFARAFLLPAHLCACGNEWDIAEMSECPLAVVRRRRRDLRALVVGDC